MQWRLKIEIVLAEHILSSKSSKNDFDIILLENNTLNTDKKEVGVLLNDFYFKTGKAIGIYSQSQDLENHRIFKATKENSPGVGFHF